ncbi:DUF488 family protein [Uruburuella testudinis]|uniref:DUF488 family protein n=1 Tax=Uruburuella testudinis TaxID=1282863 RepID=A0ABY4DTH5_9NEIS|nr:DUF488 family protein [Uruburuella testudinis]UOO82351.1 DUF488 family protein [Uruburuella testudinis]
MYRVQRIYDFHSLPPHTLAVLVDRLYPRGIPKAVMADVWWLKDLTPSAALRKWYHEDAAARFEGFAARYLEELRGSEAQQAIGRLKALAQQQDVLLLTAVKNPQQSHVSVLLDYLGEPFVPAE